MKCKTCGEKAAVNLKQHRLALCKQHFLEWMPEQTARFIKKYRMFGPDEKILVAVSGGKDSLSLWDILWRLGYQVDGLYLGLGIDEGISYSDESHRLANTYNAELRLRKISESILDEFPNIGDRRKAALLKRFGSVQRIRLAPVEQIAEIPGFGGKAALELKAFLEARQ